MKINAKVVDIDAARLAKTRGISYDDAVRSLAYVDTMMGNMNYTKTEFKYVPQFTAPKGWFVGEFAGELPEDRP